MFSRKISATIILMFFMCLPNPFRTYAAESLDNRMSGGVQVRLAGFGGVFNYHLNRYVAFELIAESQWRRQFFGTSVKALTYPFQKETSFRFPLFASCGYQYTKLDTVISADIYDLPVNIFPLHGGGGVEYHMSEFDGFVRLEGGYQYGVKRESRSHLGEDEVFKSTIYALDPLRIALVFLAFF